MTNIRSKTFGNPSTVELTRVSGHARLGLHVAGRLAPVDPLVRIEGDVAAQGSAAFALDRQPRVCRRRRLCVHTLGSLRPHKELIVSEEAEMEDYET